MALITGNEMSYGLRKTSTRKTVLLLLSMKNDNVHCCLIKTKESTELTFPVPKKNNK